MSHSSFPRMHLPLLKLSNKERRGENNRTEVSGTFASKCLRNKGISNYTECWKNGTFQPRPKPQSCSLLFSMSGGRSEINNERFVPLIIRSSCAQPDTIPTHRVHWQDAAKENWEARCLSESASEDVSNQLVPPLVKHSVE